MPVTTPGIKVDAVRRLGATVEMVGESYTETQSHAQARSHSPSTSAVVGDLSRSQDVTELQTRFVYAPWPFGSLGLQIL